MKIFLFKIFLFFISLLVISLTNETFTLGIFVSFSFSLVLFSNFYKKSGLPYIFFLFTLFGFLINPFFLEIFNPNILVSSRGAFKYYDYEFEVIRITALNIIVFLYFIDFFYNYSKKRNTKKIINSNLTAFNVGKILFLLSSPLFLYITFDVIIKVINEGYLSIFNDQKEELNSILRLSKNLIHFSFALILLSRVSINKTKKYFVAYIIIMLLTLLTGQRGDAFKFIFTAIIIYSIINEINYDFKKIVINLSIVFILALSVSIYRSSDSAKSEILNSTNTEILTDFIASQSKSYMILASSIQNENELNYSYLGLFAEFRSMSSSIISRITGINNEINEDMYLSMKKYGHLGSNISYFLNPKQFMIGKGLGTTFIAEIFLVFGIFGQIFFSFLLAKLFRLIENIKNYKLNKAVILFFFCSSLMFIGRDTSFNFVSDNLIYFILLLFYNIYERFFIRFLPKK